MRGLIGTSVGEWNTSQKVYPNPQYSNIGGNMLLGGNYKDTVCKPFIVAPNMCNITLSEWSSRASANKSLKSYGLSTREINKAWADFQNQVQKQFDRNKFVKFAKEQVQTQVDAEPIKTKPDYKDELNNLESNNQGSNNQVSANPQIELGDKKKDITQYLIYGGVGLAVIVGAVLIFKKR